MPEHEIDHSLVVRDLGVIRSKAIVSNPKSRIKKAGALVIVLDSFADCGAPGKSHGSQAQGSLRPLRQAIQQTYEGLEMWTGRRNCAHNKGGQSFE